MAKDTNGGTSRTLIVLIVLGGVVGILVVVGILAAVAIPAYQDYTVKAKVQESTNLTAPHRVALGVACAESSLAANQTNKDFGLMAPERYSGADTKSVSVSVQSETNADVTIVYRAIGSVIKEGQTAIYRGTCDSGRMSWAADGTIQARYWPKM